MSSNFFEDYLDWQTPEESWWVQWLKCDKDEDIVNKVMKITKFKNIMKKLLYIGNNTVLMRKIILKIILKTSAENKNSINS